jgi:MscS family membrane protein
MAMMATILELEFWGNSVKQYSWFLGVLLFVIIFNRYISRIISKLLFSLLKRTRFKDKGKEFLKLMMPPLEYIVVLHTLFIGFNSLHAPEFFQETFLGTSISGYLFGIYRLLFILSTGWLFSRFGDFFITVLNERAEETPDPGDDQVIAFMKDVIKVIIWTSVILCILAFVFDVNVTSIVAGAGIAGIAIAFAAQETLQNILGSISIFSEKPFVVGELVEVDGVTGTVDKVGFRSTRVVSLDTAYMTIPNRNIVAGKISNLSRRSSRRVQFILGLEYQTSAELINKIVDDIRMYTNTHQRTNEPSVVTFYGFGASSLDIWVEFYIEYLAWEAYMPVRHEMMMGILQIVQRNGARFAYPTQTLIFKGENPTGNILPATEQEEVHQPKGE